MLDGTLHFISRHHTSLITNFIINPVATRAIYSSNMSSYVNVTRDGHHPAGFSTPLPSLVNSKSIWLGLARVNLNGSDALQC